jgi:formate dehydrogenase iron-sulfur subunit
MNSTAAQLPNPGGLTERETPWEDEDMVNRRDFLKLGGTAAGTAALTAVGATPAHARPLVDPDRIGVLVDTTYCIGCRRCEFACGEENDNPHQELSAYDDTSVMAEMRRPDAESYTVVNRYSAPEYTDQPMDVKVNCLHCDHPACVSACIVGALEKNPMGPVTYDAWKCIGCRYCMVACPFQIPAYEYANATTPRVMKCNLCVERTLEQGKQPACVEICPKEALVYGKRSDLVKLAHRKIREHPGRYHDEVYGEHTVGGTSWMYIADRPLTDLDLPELPDESPAEITEGIQHGIFRGFSGPIMLFGLMSVLLKSSGDKRKEMEDENE